MTTPEVTCAVDTGARLGEGAIWSIALQRLLWVDIPAGDVHRFDPATGTDTVTPLGRPVGCVAETARGTVIAALTDGFHEVDLDTGAETRLAGPAPADWGHRFNDGTVDPAGRFLAGTMRLAGPSEDHADGRLFVLDRGESRETLGGFHVVNGMAFSPDGRTYYVSDSIPSLRRIWSCDYDPETGRMGERRLFFDTAGLAGRPDGGAMDAAGCYWIAGVGGGQLYRVTPRGELDLTVDMPVSRPSRIAFGGPDLDTLFVTTIAVEGEAQSGAVFSLRVPGVSGIPMPVTP